MVGLMTVMIGPLVVGTGPDVLTGLEVYSFVAGVISVESMERYDLIASLDHSVIVDRVIDQGSGMLDIGT
jgi:hypothetical protein